MRALNDAQASKDDWPSNYGPVSAWWAVTVMMIFNIVSLIDRQLVAVLLPEMRADLQLNDFQISLVQGMAFALFYGGAGLFIGGLIDRYSRQWIMFSGIVIWSVAAAACGLSRNYVHLFLGRLFVGFGEGAISPAAQSLLASIFPRHKLSTAMSGFTVAGVAGISLSYGLGGYLLDTFTRAPLGGPLQDLEPWRQVLIVTGLPGLLVAFLAFTVRKPIRAGAPAPSREAATWRSFFAYLLQNRRLMGGIILGSGLCAMLTQAAMSWAPTFARRILNQSASEAGSMMATTVAFGGIIGGIGMGLLIDHFFKKGVRDIAFRILTGVTLVTPPFVAMAFLAEDPRLLAAATTLMMLTLGAISGPTLAAVQMVAPKEMRGRFAALAVLSANLFGFAFGPMMVGALTDYVFHDPNKLGLSVAISVLVIAPFAAWLIWSVRRDFLSALDR